MTRLSRILSRLAALALLALLLGATWHYVVEPVTAHVRQINESIALNRQLVDRLVRSIGSRAELTARIEALRDEMARSSHYLRAATEPLAAAKMRKQLQRALGRGNVDVKSFQALASSEAIALTRVNARVVLQGEFDALIEAFYRLETEEPYLFIDDLRLKRAAARRARQGMIQPTKLSVVFLLSGFLPPEVEP